LYGYDGVGRRLLYSPHRPQHQNGEKLAEEYTLLYYRYSSLAEYASIIAQLRERQASLLKKGFWRGKRLG
jgi:hypothetical protein